MTDVFDLVVIGSGPAGEKGAAQAAYFGKKVAIVERSSEPGGVVVSDAGVPTKTLRETALYITGFKQREVYGLSLNLDPAVTLEALTSRAADVIAISTQAVRANIERHGIELIHGHGSLGPGRRVRVRLADGGERVLSAGVILLAPGSRPAHPAGIPFDDPDVHDSVSILRLDRIPRSLVVVGAGAVGCEYASIFTALGVRVTLLDPGPRLLPFADAEASGVLAAAFRAVGMDLRQRARAALIERAGGLLTVRLDDGGLLRPEKVLFAAGRRETPTDSGWGSWALTLTRRAGSWWTGGSRPPRPGSTRLVTSSGRRRWPVCPWNRAGLPSAMRLRFPSRTPWTRWPRWACTRSPN